MSWSVFCRQTRNTLPLVTPRGYHHRLHPLSSTCFVWFGPVLQYLEAVCVPNQVSVDFLMLPIPVYYCTVWSWTWRSSASNDGGGMHSRMDASSSWWWADGRPAGWQGEGQCMVQQRVLQWPSCSGSPGRGFFLCLLNFISRCGRSNCMHV